MSKKSRITFSVDLDKDPDLIFEEIKLRIERELKRKGSSDKQAALLSVMHEVCNEHTGSDFASTNDLIRALADFASPKMKARILDSSPTGRRKTISMNQEMFDQITSLLALPDANKAAIARKTGVSVVQVRKVAFGGYDKKYGKGKKVTLTPKLPEERTTPRLPIQPPKPPLQNLIRKERSVTRPPMRLGS